MYFKKDRVSTGVRELDIILEGGYKRPSVVLTKGELSKELFSIPYFFAASALKREEPVVFITNSVLPSKIESDLSNLTNKLSTLRFIDCYSKYTGQFDSTRKDIVIDSPSLLNEISLAINDVIEEFNSKKINFIFNTISGFLLYNKPQSLMKFLQLNLGKLKHANAVTFLIMDTTTENNELNTFLEYSSDYLLNLSIKEGKGTLKINGISYPLPIKSSAFGIEII